ncbi:hypothetical protein T484DRAFT_1647963, partial [Baffinella frigidus]
MSWSLRVEYASAGTCAAGYFGGGNGVTGCNGCGELRTSVSGNVPSEGCMCSPGNYPYGNGAECQNCPVGTFKSGMGQHGCTNCGAGTYWGGSGVHSCAQCRANTYSTTVKATSSSACIACPSNTASTLGSNVITRCSCIAGYTATAVGRACTACGVGTYKSLAGISECIPCPVGNYTDTVGSLSCKPC